MPSGGQQQELEDFGVLMFPEEAFEPILHKTVRGALLAWLEEIWAEKQLAAAGIAPRRRALFVGPPGVGKTTLCHHLAARLGLPLLAVQPDRLIDSWVGSTARNMARLFELVDQQADLDPPQPIMVMLDEFDAIAQKRRQANQGAEDEQNAWVNTLLQRIEAHTGFIVAASNREGAIDPAIWRRFDLQIALSLPQRPECARILGRYLAPARISDAALKQMAPAFVGASPALIRAFCENLKRDVIVGPRLNRIMTKDAAIGRVLESVQPHPDLGKPPMWSESHERKQAMLAFPWPIELPTGEPCEAGAEA